MGLFLAVLAWVAVKIDERKTILSQRKIDTTEEKKDMNANKEEKRKHHKVRNDVLVVLGIIIVFFASMSYIYSPKKLIGTWITSPFDYSKSYIDVFKGAGKGFCNGSPIDYTYYWFGILYISCKSEGYERTYSVSFSNHGRYMTLKDLSNKDKVILLIRTDKTKRSY